MKLTNNLPKLLFYIITLGGLLIYFILADILKWIIAGASILYLIFYFSIATIAVFSVTLSELGPVLSSMSQKSPLLSLVVTVPIILLLWIVLLLFWPLFVIPESSFIRKPEKYEAIAEFEAAVRTKYSKF